MKKSDIIQKSYIFTPENSGNIKDTLYSITVLLVNKIAVRHLPLKSVLVLFKRSGDVFANILGIWGDRLYGT